MIGLYLVVRKVKNRVGRFMGYSGCPNCGDSWYWKPSGVVPYAKTRGVMICEECLLDLDYLCIRTIEEDLLKAGWEPDEVNQVGFTLLNFKSQHMRGRL